MEKLKDVDTWGAECQHYLSPEVKTMDGFVFRHLKDCGFLDYRSNRKMTSSLDFIRSCTANSELEVEMERRDRTRGIFLNSREAQSDNNKVRSKLLSGIVKTLDSFLHSQDRDFKRSTSEHWGHDLKAQRDWEKYVEKRENEYKDKQHGGSTSAMIDMLMFPDMMLSEVVHQVAPQFEDARKVDWVKYARWLFQKLFQEAVIGGTLLHFDLNTKLLQLCTLHESLQSGHSNTSWEILGIEKTPRLNMLTALNLSATYENVTIDEGDFFPCPMISEQMRNI